MGRGIARGSPMVVLRKNFSSLCLFLFSISQAMASVEVQVTPEESAGNPITLKFILKNESDFKVEKAPQENSDWRVSPPSRHESLQFSYADGAVKKVSSITLSYTLVPKKSGKLKIPLAQIRVKNKVYSSPQKSIRVTQNSGTLVAPKTKSPNFPLFPLDDEDNTGPSLTPSSSELRKLEVAIVPEPSKTEVYAGELIVLPFYIYTNENIFRNLEFAAFPTFKDFIKEELFLPKSWRTEKVKYRGDNYFRAEIIRFGIFPLKDGELLIDPLKMRFEVDSDIFDIAQEMMGRGKVAPRADRTFLRTSGSIPVTVKALPPKPESVAQSEIPVGKYNINLKAPNVDLVQNEAFNLKIRVEGTGNIKGIPEPEIKLAAGLQKGKTETDYSINTLSEGYKDFELLIVPRNSGNINIPENSWTYFDPDKKAYETLKMPSIELKIAPSNRSDSPKQLGSRKESLIFAGNQDFESEGDTSLPPWVWSFPALFYAFSGFLFVQRRNHEKEEALLSSQPWIAVERKIAVQRDLSSNEALGLVEEWILCRFRPLGIEEAAFEDMTDALRKKVPTNVEAKIEKLKASFKQIEFARFGGKKGNSLNLSFAEIKKLSEEIVLASVNHNATVADDTEEE